MGRGLGPFLPLPAAPPVLLPGTRLEGSEVKKQSTPAVNYQVAEDSREGLTRPRWPAPEACGKRMWYGGREQGLARPAQIQDGAALACWVPCELETALGSSSAG